MKTFRLVSGNDCQEEGLYCARPRHCLDWQKRESMGFSLWIKQLIFLFGYCWSKATQKENPSPDGARELGENHKT
jgi:hypothetical protein